MTDGEALAATEDDTAAEHLAAGRAWVKAELMLRHPELTEGEALALVEFGEMLFRAEGK
jgi:hypothetical protein